LNNKKTELENDGRRVENFSTKMFSLALGALIYLIFLSILWYRKLSHFALTPFLVATWILSIVIWLDSSLIWNSDANRYWLDWVKGLLASFVKICGAVMIFSVAEKRELFVMFTIFEAGEYAVNIIRSSRELDQSLEGLTSVLCILGMSLTLLILSQRFKSKEVKDYHRNHNFKKEIGSLQILVLALVLQLSIGFYDFFFNDLGYLFLSRKMKELYLVNPSGPVEDFYQNSSSNDSKRDLDEKNIRSSPNLRIDKKRLPEFLITIPSSLGVGFLIWSGIGLVFVENLYGCQIGEKFDLTFIGFQMFVVFVSTVLLILAFTLKLDNQQHFYSLPLVYTAQMLGSMVSPAIDTLIGSFVNVHFGFYYGSSTLLNSLIGGLISHYCEKYINLPDESAQQPSNIVVMISLNSIFAILLMIAMYIYKRKSTDNSEESKQTEKKATEDQMLPPASTFTQNSSTATNINILLN
ncbi:MAG: hypothetical protein MHPSP_001767, partial [Paramarteilia canceri]